MGKAGVARRLWIVQSAEIVEVAGFVELAGVIHSELTDLARRFEDGFLV